MRAKKYLEVLKAHYKRMPYAFQNAYGSANWVWDSWEKNLNLTRPNNIKSIAENFRDEYSACFQRLREHYNKEDGQEVYLGYFPIIDFNAKANTTVYGERVIIYDEFRNTFVIQFLLICINLAFNGDLSVSERRKCKEYLKYLLSFYQQRKIDKKSHIEYLDFFNHIASHDDIYVFQSAVGANAVFYFTIGHELGHHYHDHVGEKEFLFESNGDLPALEFDIFQHQQEYEADDYGFNIFLKIVAEGGQRENDNTNVNDFFDRFPLLFFDVITLHYDYALSTGAISQVPTSHPSPHKRKEALIQKYGDRLSENGEKLYEPVLQVMQSLREELGILNIR